MYSLLKLFFQDRPNLSFLLAYSEGQKFFLVLVAKP